MQYLAIAAILAVVAALIITDGTGSVAGVEPDTLAGVAFGVGTLVLVTAGYWRRFGSGLGVNLRHALIWLALGLACIVGYSYRDEIQGVRSRVVGELRPGTAVVSGQTVAIVRRQDGDFEVEAEVNGRVQTFAFDTGASAVVLTAENAAALGIRPGDNDFTTRVSTANGTAYAAPILIDAISIGPITERRIPALVARTGALAQNLLGQSFLTRLPGYEVRGDRLILRGR
ncbi:TIGR02281 family clan AA aspartic protease [Methylobacterium radiodurans]|uniref:TIGR02281 family clan AA aspartic protease n=1 Tax=Methylobacterium radiodurans TaxID=2202828 RepID=A0A2U8W017_9HYPH|nr:TIGR02281 family clan AA aspartic protease [Methylobacterium radiodurans]